MSFLNHIVFGSVRICEVTGHGAVHCWTSWLYVQDAHSHLSYGDTHTHTHYNQVCVSGSPLCYVWHRRQTLTFQWYHFYPSYAWPHSQSIQRQQQRRGGEMERYSMKYGETGEERERNVGYGSEVRDANLWREVSGMKNSEQLGEVWVEKKKRGERKHTQNLQVRLQMPLLEGFICERCDGDDRKKSLWQKVCDLQLIWLVWGKAARGIKKQSNFFPYSWICLLALGYSSLAEVER